MKIAIVKLSALGDIIHSGFILQFMKKYIPDAEIDWFVEESFAPILETNQDIRKIQKVNLKSIKKSFSNLKKEIKRLRDYSKENYDIVIDLQGLMKSAIASRILSSNIAGYDKKSIRESFASIFYSKKFYIPYDENTIDRYRILVSLALNIDITLDDVIYHKPYLFYSENDLSISKNYLLKDKPNVVFIIGSTWQSRIYPKEQLVNIANELDANILVPFGNDSEKDDAQFLAMKCKNIHMLPKMNLKALTALISNCDLLIGNDTGPSYIAWANNIPSIVLFGPTPATRIYNTKIHKLLKSPSFVDHYKLDKNDFSIKEIKEQEIIKTARELLSDI